MLLNSMFQNDVRALLKNARAAEPRSNDGELASDERRDGRERRARPRPLAALRRWARAGQLGQPVTECC